MATEQRTIQLRVIDIFRKYLEDKIPLSNDEFARIASVGEIRKLRPRQYLLQEGDVWKFNAFILIGLVRVYNVDENGNEHVLSFAKENWWTGDRASLLSGKASKFNIDALEPTTVLLIEKESFDKICREIPAMGDLVHDIIQKSFIASQERIQIIKNFNAEQKYLDLTARYPDFAIRIPLHMIASFLGITKETLSRVRSQLSKK